MNRTLKRLAAGISAAAMVLAAAPAVPAPKADAAGKILAFPGAVGGGKYATGGRGGEVYHVTNLNDSGEGSFRDAVSKSGRIVVFDVSGTIELKGNIICTDNVTIAGQTAPGGSGITLKNYKMGMGGDNIICRYISSRPGPYAATSSGNDGWGGAKGSNSIIDHCSMSWTTDEQWGLYSNNTNYTVQYSVIGPADSWGGHKKGLHGFGIMMGKGDLSFDHNLIIHNVSRNFRGKVPQTFTADFTNNIIYDWGYQTAYGTIGHLNYVNNTLKAGNSTTGGYHWINVDSTTSPQNFKIYCAGNRLINKDGSVHAITYDNWAGVTVKSGIGITKDDLYSASPFGINSNGENLSSVAGAESAEASYEHVVNFAGNGISPEKRTAVDRQCAYETTSGTGQCSGTAAFDSSESKLTSNNIKCGVTYTYPDAVLKKEITDKDNDGMADDWELARGLDPNDPTDYSGDYCGQGYMNIEYYINDLTVDSFPAGVVKLSPTEGVTPAKTISAFETIEAESYDDQEGVKTEENDDGTSNIGYIESGDYVVFNRVDFGSGAKTFGGRISGNPADIELYLDSPDGDPAAKVSFEGTSGFTDYTDVVYNIPQIKGVHRLYIKFTGGEGYLVNADSFIFGKDAIPLSGDFFKDVQVTAQANPDSWKIGRFANIGSLIFGDRTFTITDIPEYIMGAEILMTSCDAKGTKGTAASFTTGAEMEIFVGVDSRVEKLPEFLADYEPTDMTISTDNDVIFKLYKKTFAEGETVELGSNGQTYMCVNYTVFGIPHFTWEPIRDIGDVNGDEEISVADLVLLSQYLLGQKPLSEDDLPFADMNEDGKVDTFDLVQLRFILCIMRGRS